MRSIDALDTKSLRFKLWAYFVLFAVVLMSALWLFQIIFLQPYYQEMKKKEILHTAHSITAKYHLSPDASSSKQDELLREITEIIADAAYKNDMYITIKANDMILTPLTENPGHPPRFFGGSPIDLRLLEQKLLQSPTGTISLLQKSRNGKNDTMLFGKLLSKGEDVPPAVLCISAPLTPLESTISILAGQLIIVTIASLILACALSIWISRRVTAPILQITKKAGDLATGQYGISFEGGHYSEIQHLANTLTFTSRELAKADNLQKDLIANVSHDLRTPLTMVKSYAEMIRDLSGEDPQKRKAHLQVIIDEADRLNLLVNDLLFLSKMQSGVETMQTHAFDLKQTIQALLMTYTILEAQKGYEFSFFVNGIKETNISNFDTPLADDAQTNATHPFMVCGDENRLKQVISNLLNNAIFHGCDGGAGKEITVRLDLLPLQSNGTHPHTTDLPATSNASNISHTSGTCDTGYATDTTDANKASAANNAGSTRHAHHRESSGNETPLTSYIRVSVSDCGPGIPPEELEHIWDRYYKASKQGHRSASGGSGLGLSIVKEILLLHRARFGVDSTVGEGSTFWFELPQTSDIDPP